MTELKTLKDFEFIENYSKENYRDDHTHEIDDCCAKEAVDIILFKLQESGKDDIKEILKFDKTEEDKLWEKFTGLKIKYSEEGKQAIINYIKWKFNIK